jgi:hypothetical protein
LKDAFPQIWVPRWENRDLRQLLWHRHRMVQTERLPEDITSQDRGGIPQSLLMCGLMFTKKRHSIHLLPKQTCYRYGRRLETVIKIAESVCTNSMSGGS